MSEVTKRTFKKIASVTRELMKVKPGTEYHVRFVSAMFIGKEMPPKTKVDPKTGEVSLEKRGPAHIAYVDNLETDAEQQIICSTVLRKEIDEAYPGNAYIGKCFWFRITKVEGKDYNLCEIAEVEDPDPTRSAEVISAWIEQAKKKQASAQPADSSNAATAEEANAAPAEKAKSAKK